nr:DUF4406 domain-containing protein [Pseudomonas aeruginosa]
MPEHIAVNWGAKFTNDAWEGWQARAALAQPSPAAVQLSGSRERRIYVAGPMTGYKDFNFPAFNAQAEELRGLGYHVENPAEHGIVDGAEWQDYLRYDIGRLSTCEAIFLLPGWSKSKGAALEVHIAKALGMTFIHHADAEHEQPSPAQAEQAEQAEAERPEVVAYFDRNYPSTGDAFIWSNYEGSPYEPVMTVAQHDRIAGALRAENAQLSEDLNRLSIIRARLNLRLDFALDKISKLESRWPHGESPEERFEHYISNTIDRAPEPLRRLGNWLSHVLDEDQWTTAERMLTGACVAAEERAAAQTQHSVPEGWKPVPIEPLLNMMSDKDHDTRIMAERQLLSILADAPGKEVPQAWLDVQAERRRQVEAEGWTPKHDDEHADGQMAQAAGCYALHAGGIGTDWPDGRQNGAALFWPWDKDSWKPTTPRRDLVKACALALAEIERLDRAAATQGGPSDA